MNFLLASTLVLLTIGSLECYPNQRIPNPNIIQMPYSVRSFNQPQQQQQQQPQPCGSAQCLNAGQCQLNPYTNQPSCACKSPFYGSQCEFYQPQAGQQPQQPQQPQQQQPNNLCRVFNERNMNICQNGGQCVFVADGKVACICPTTHKGLFCELPTYLPCNGDPAKTCHRDHGICDRDGNCVCSDGYTGLRCDKIIACNTGYCLNDAECLETDDEPYRNCICKENYFGKRCEKFGLDFKNGTVKVYNRACNLSISVFNQGGYLARFSVDYDDIVNGERRTIRSGDFPSAATRKLTVPFYGENLNVRIQTIHGEVIVNDRSLVEDLPCYKCYKIWGAVGMGKWDYIKC